MLRIIKQPSRVLSDVLYSGANNFNLLRLIAALCVLIGHAQVISTQSFLDVNTIDPLHLDSLSSLAANFFFFLSGLLVSNSLIHDSNISWFLIRRFFRIVPGLFVSLLMAILIVGPLFTKLSIADYLSSKDTWAYLWSNLSFTYSTTRLPGVFTDSRFGLNDSLLSLGYEIICYLYMAIFCSFGLFRIRLLLNLCGFGVIIATIVTPDLIPRFGDSDASSMFLASFVVGVIFAVNKQLIKIDLGRVLLVWLLFVLFNMPMLREFLVDIAVFYTGIYIGSLPGVVRKLSLPFDASLGVFVYGFLIQQCVHALFPMIGLYAALSISLALAVFLGVVSWYLVEKYANFYARKNFSDKLLKDSQLEQATSFVQKTREKILSKNRSTGVFNEIQD